MEALPLKYNGYTIVLQEVPDEISLVFNISGCPHKCEGCHSKYLWEYDGEYLHESFDRIVNEYSQYITCVCFMGGDQNKEELLVYLKKAKKKNLKTCLYTGCDNLNELSILKDYCDYIKCGKYIESLKTDNNIQYGVKLATSNQMFYKKGKDY